MNEMSSMWQDLDAYFEANLLGPDDVLASSLARASEAGLPDHGVSPLQGALLAIIARIGGARRVLEIGTLAAYSTIWLARAVGPGGNVVTLESNPAHAAVARENVAAAGVADRVRFHVGPAAETLESLKAEGGNQFDLVFIDADKENNQLYFEYALSLTGRGATIVVDNVVRSGAILDSASADPSVKGVQSLVSLLSGDTRVAATAIQTVGAKGHDGFLIASVL